MNILELLKQAFVHNASDLHITVNSPPMYRIHGELSPDGVALCPVDTEHMAREMMTVEQWDSFLCRGELDFPFSIPGVSRYRVNVYRQRGCVSIAARVIPNFIPTCEDLRLPEVTKALVEAQSGLVLVTGPTGSGKSSTLAALIDHLNRTKRVHILTLEDPIEYIHIHNLSIIDQREIGIDTHDFASALRAALRQDPDVILVGEMRDLETISTAITAAETGHLVLATLHTSDTVQTIDRIIDVFPAAQQSQIRFQLAAVLQGIISQRLHKRMDGQGRVASFEILVNTPAVANLIRTEKVHQIRSVLQTGRSLGMQTMDLHLQQLIAAEILPKTALTHSQGL